MRISTLKSELEEGPLGEIRPDNSRLLSKWAIINIGTSEVYMSGSHIIRNLLFIAGVGIGMGSSFGEDQVDCNKLNANLCHLLTNAQSDTDKFTVIIVFYYPEVDSECKGVDPRTNPSDKCRDRGYDSAYNAKLVEDAYKMFSTYELWNSKDPTQRLQAPTEPTQGFKDVLATKATLLTLNKESYINTISSYDGIGPAGNRPVTLKRMRSMTSQEDSYLINGRRSVNVPARIPRWNNSVIQ